jgi:4'-phosphopantetheinyl transferase
VPDAGICTVWWASIDMNDDGLGSLLNPVEAGRVASLRQPKDRARSTIGAAVLRLAAGAHRGVPASGVVVDRTCRRCERPHGRPTLPGTGLHASVSHAGEWVAVALSDAGPVGVDVEAVSDVDIDALASSVLGPAEAGAVNAARDFFVYWTRKESVMKATGDGLTAPMAQVLVTPPDSPPALLGYPGRPGLRARMHDLAAPTGYLAAVTVLTEYPVTVIETDAATLRDPPGPVR